MDRIDLYFASLAAWINHPGYLREGAQPPTLEAIANQVDAMLELRNKKWPWPSEQSEQR